MIGLFIIAAALTAAPSDVDAARTDYRAHGSDPALRYLTLGAVPKGKRSQWAAMVAFSIPSASREEILDHQIPQQVPGSTAYRIDLNRLGWDWRDFEKVLAKYPYSLPPAGYAPRLVIRGDWLARQLADTRENDSYYRLLYGGKNIPKTDADFLKFWRVEADQQQGQRYGWTETRSLVSKQESRFIEHFNARGLALWRTLDVNHITTGSDPLEVLDGTFKADGKELIAAISKVSIAKGTRGTLQTYLLANGQGKVVNDAPVRLVQDYTLALGDTSITTPASCIVCHTSGLQMPNENGLRESLKAGVQVYAYDKNRQQQLEAFHLTDSGVSLARSNQDYATAVAACNGLTTAENARNYKACLDQYRADLSLEDCARELYCTADELRLAIAYASANRVIVGARLAGLTAGRKISRDNWEELYLKTQAMLDVWSQGGRK